MKKNPQPTYGCQIYVLTPPQIPDLNVFAQRLQKTLTAAPIAALQVRLKDTPKETIIKTVERLMPIAHTYGTLLIVNDDPEIARDTGADGVHLGQSDMNIKSAQDMLKPDAIIGITCHNSKDLAFKAGSDGADYIAFGAFFESLTKPDARPANLELLQWWHETMEIPSVAIGGINPDNAKPVIKAGADFIALSSGVWDYTYGPEQAVRRLWQYCSQFSPLGVQ